MQVGLMACQGWKREYDGWDPAEAWAIAAAQRAGVATASLVATGVEAGVPYMVSLYVPPADDEVDHPWSWLGTYARAVAGIGLDGAPPALYSRFGTDLPADPRFRAAVTAALDRLFALGAKATVAAIAGR